MTSPTGLPGPHDPDRLRDLVNDAVADVEPVYALDAIRARTATARPSSSASARRWDAGGGALLAAAAVVTAVVLVVPGNGPSADAPPAGQPTATDPPATAPGTTSAIAVYYIGDTGRGPRLFREFRNVEERVSPLKALGMAPNDPDYRTLWPEGAFSGQHSDPEAGLVLVEALDSLRDRPAGITRAEAELAVQQLVYTTQGLVGERAAVGLLPTADGSGSGSLYGVDLPVGNESSDDVLSQMSIGYPFEGAVVEDSFRATGVNNSFEASVIWRIEDASGAILLDGHAQAAGWGEDRLYPWRTRIDVTDLATGTYTFVASNDDPSGGTEGTGPDADTRTIVVE